MRTVVVPCLLIAAAAAAGWTLHASAPPEQPPTPGSAQRVPASAVVDRTVGDLPPVRTEPAPRLVGCPAPAPTVTAGPPPARRLRRTELDEHEELCERMGYPADPRPVGPCRLEIRFVHTVTGEPAETTYELWHLDAPASTTWSAGARLRALSECRETPRVVVEDLPAGRYRVVTPRVARGEADPPAFDVEGAVTSVRLAIRPPGTLRIHLRIRDEEGRLRLSATRRFGLCCGSYASNLVPPWANPRHVLVDGRTNEGEASTHWDGEGGGDRTLEADASGVLTDSGWHMSARDASTWQAATYHVEGGSDVELSEDSDGADNRFYAAVSVPLAWVRERIRHADGRPLTETDALEVRASASALRLPDERPDESAWRSIPIRVRVLRHGDEVGTGVLLAGQPDRLVILPPAAQ